MECCEEDEWGKTAVNGAFLSVCLPVALFMEISVWLSEW